MRSRGRQQAAKAAVAFGVALGCALAASTGSADPVSPASRLSKGDSSSEYWDLSAVFGSGYKLFARFTISNEGPGDETAYAIGQIVFPDGRVSQFQNGRRKGRWSLSEDGLRIEIGSSILDLHDPTRQIEVDKNRDGQKIFLDYEGAPKAARAWATAPEGYRFDLLDSGTPIAGTLWVREITPEPVEVSGLLTSTHTSMEKNESTLTLRRVELHSASSGGSRESVYLIDVLAAKGGSKRWLVVRRDGERVLATDSFALEYVGANPASRDDHPLPARLVVKSTLVNGTVTLGEMLVRHEPLDIAPFPFGWLLSRTMDPVHMWLDAKSELVVTLPGTPAQRVESAGVVSVFYVNKMD